MSIFRDKEHYIAFRKAWSAAVQSPRAKSQVKTFQCSGMTSQGHSISEYNERIKGWLKAEHHLLYNYCRQRPLYTGFTPIHDKIGLMNGHYVNHGLYWANFRLRVLIRYAKSWLESCENFELTPSNELHRRQFNNWNEFTHRQCKEFLAPFDGTITLKMLAQIEIPEIDPMSIYWPYHTDMVKRIIAGERFTMEELWPMMLRENRTNENN